MDKAGRSLRRSATRLIFTNESESDLAVALQEWKRVKSASSSFADVQREAAEFLLKWSLKEDNRAIKDAAFQLNELVRLWTDAQCRFSTDLQMAIDELNKIRDLHKNVKDVEKRVAMQVEKEEKLRKELQSPCRWRKGGDVILLQHNLEEATRNRRIVEQRASETKLEQEASKMLVFKRAMRAMAQSYLDMGEACTLVFEAHWDIADKIPDACDLAPSQLPSLNYDGGQFTRHRVEVVRRRMSEGMERNRASPMRPNYDALEQRRRVSDTAAHLAGVWSSSPSNRATSQADPPPPYSP